jgi:hypothetical protein
MKKKITKNLQIDKETIAKLDDQQLNNVDGGVTNVQSLTCNQAASTEEQDAAFASCVACSCNGAPAPATPAAS